MYIFNEDYRGMLWILKVDDRIIKQILQEGNEKASKEALKEAIEEAIVILLCLRGYDFPTLKEYLGKEEAKEIHTLDDLLPSEEEYSIEEMLSYWNFLLDLARKDIEERRNKNDR